MPQLYANLSKNSSVPSVHGGVLWGDDINKRFYLFGGEYSQQPPADSGSPLWAYDVLNNRWDLFGPPPAFVSAVSYGAGVTISERGEGYYYGGWLSNNSIPGWRGARTATTSLLRYTMDTNEVSTCVLGCLFVCLIAPLLIAILADQSPFLPCSGRTLRGRRTGSGEQKAPWFTSLSVTAACWCTLAASKTLGMAPWSASLWTRSICTTSCLRGGMSSMLLATCPTCADGSALGLLGPEINPATICE